MQQLVGLTSFKTLALQVAKISASPVNACQFQGNQSLLPAAFYGYVICRKPNITDCETSLPISQSQPATSLLFPGPLFELQAKSHISSNVKTTEITNTKHFVYILCESLD